MAPLRSAVVDEATEGRRSLALSEVASLYESHGAELVAAVKKMGARGLAEDIVQETFLRLMHYPTAAILHPRAFLIRIARNVLYDRVREGAREVGPLTNSPTFREDRDATAPDQFEAVLLKQLLTALPEIYRDVFLLSRFCGMSYDQIAEARGISVKTVEWRMSRALEMCSAKMRE